MTIETLSSRTNNKYVTVTFTYEEVRDMANGLYHVCKDKPEYKSIKDKCRFLFDMVKEGMIQPGTVIGMSESYDVESKEEKQSEVNN